MFFILSKFLYFLILPFSWIVLTFVWSLFSKHPIRKVKLIRLAFLLIIVFSNPWLSHKAFQSLEAKPNQLLKTYDIGIVLSGMLESGISLPNQTHLAQSADRIIEAVRLYKKGAIRKILISGGKADINFPEENEGLTLVQLVRDLGVPDSAILLENRSRNTFENAKYTAELLGNKFGDLLLITSAFHIKRASACFKKVGLDFDVYPVDYRTPSEFRWVHVLPKSGALENWNVMTKEVVGMIVYKMVGYV